MEQFLAVLAELDVVLAWNNPEREVLALVVGFELIGMAGFGPSPFHIGLCDRFSLGVFASSLHRACGLREREWSGQPRGEDEQQGKDEIFLHDLPPGIESEFTGRFALVSVSGHRFSDAASYPKSDAPLGAEHRMTIPEYGSSSIGRRLPRMEWDLPRPLRETPAGVAHSCRRHRRRDLRVDSMTTLNRMGHSVQGQA